MQARNHEKKIIVPNELFRIVFAEKMRKSNQETENYQKKILIVLSILDSHGGKSCRSHIMEALYEKMYGKSGWYESMPTFAARNTHLSRIFQKAKEALRLMNCEFCVGPKKYGPDAQVAVLTTDKYVAPSPRAWMMITNPDPALAKEFEKDRLRDQSLIR